jgi:hypothetical protein
MSEHIKALFEGQDLSEEFKTKATAIVQSAIDEKVETVKAELQEEFETRVATRIKELEELTEQYIQEEMVPQFDKYLTAAVTEWQEENKIALVSGAKVELAESFLSGMVGLVESHDLTMPQSKVDAIAEMQSKLDEMTESMNALKEQNIELVEAKKTLVRANLVKEATAELSDSQKDKLAQVVEKLEFKTEEQFTGAIKSLIESYFPTESHIEPIVENVEPVQEKAPIVAKSYAQSLIEQAIRV